MSQLNPVSPYKLLHVEGLKDPRVTDLLRQLIRVLDKVQIDVSTAVNSKQDAGNYALLNSPAFTGVPTAPTAAAGTNNTQIATTAYADAAVATAVAADVATDDARYASSMFNIAVNQASNLLTFILAPCKVDFRNTTLATGLPIEYNVASNFTLAMTSIAGSLGAPTTTVARIAIALVYAAGSPQIAIANLSGGLQMDESNLITTSAIGAGSTSATTWYSTSAIGTPSQYRIIGFCDAVWTTGVGWSSPTTVQPSAGLFMSALGGASLTANGYQKFPSGLIIQWGTGGVASPSPLAVTFPIAFPHAVLASFANMSGTNASLIATTAINSNSTMTVYSNAGGLSGVYWFAIGW